jgi:hypothetical protein
MRPLRTTLVTLALACGACVHDFDDFPSRVEQALDAADVDLDDVMAIGAQSIPGGTVVAAELVVESTVIPLPAGGVVVADDALFLADVWRDGRLSRAFVDLGGDVEDIDDYGTSDRAAEAADVIERAGVSMPDAARIAQDVVDDGRTFSATVEGARYAIEVVARGRIYAVDISPDDGSIVEIDVEGDWHHHDCPHWGC